jgi:G3E family GTPase
VLDLFGSSEIGPFGRRQRTERGHRVPVAIATGIRQGPNTATVLDDFGADDVVPLRNGCACCTVRLKLQDRLRRLLAERQQGLVPHFSRIAIQTGEEFGPIRRMFASSYALEAEFYLEEDAAQVAEHTHGDGIAHFALREDAPLDWDAFSRFITTLMTLRGADLLWAKGLLNVKGCRGPVVVQFVQHLAHRPVELAEWPDAHRSSRIVFVTRSIEERAVRSLFDAVRALA